MRTATSSPDRPVTVWACATRLGEKGSFMSIPASSGAGDVPRTYDWRNPVARIVIIRQK